MNPKPVPSPNDPVKGNSTDLNVAGVTGTNSISAFPGSFEASQIPPEQGVGVFGNATIGVLGLGYGGTAIHGIGQIGVHGQGYQYAGLFDGPVRVNGNAQVHGSQTVTGNVQVNGDHTVTGNFQVNGNQDVKGTISVGTDVVLGDCAEDFDVTDPTGPGTVMVIGDSNALRPSDEPYDPRVAGVVSGGGEYKPALVLDRRLSLQARSPLALVGKVYCKVDADYEPINVGDLLTTSPTPGHAMRAVDRDRAFGAVIGKALKPLKGGQDLIPILVALQ